MDPRLPVRISDAGARHLILGAATRQRLADLDYDFAALKMLMEELELVTSTLSGAKIRSPSMPATRFRSEGWSRTRRRERRRRR